MAVAPKVTGFPGMGDYRPPKPGPNYVWNPTKRKWVKKAGKGNPKPPRVAGQTASEWADMEAQRIVDRQLAAIEERQKAWQEGLQAEAARRAQQAQAFAQMVQGLGIDKQIQGVFNTAGKDISGLAGGFAGNIRDIAAADAAQQTRMLSGTGQEGAVRNEGVGMGDVAYGAGGMIPGRSLMESGAVFGADAAMQPGFMLQQAIQDAQNDYAEQSANNPFLDAIMDVKLGKQGIADKLREERREQNFAQAEMRLKQIESDRDYWLKMQAMYLSQKKYKLAAQAEARARAAETRYANETAGLDAYGEVSPDYYKDGQGRIVPKGYKYNKQGVLVKAATAGKSGGRGSTLTANEQQRQLEKVHKSEDDVKKLARQLAIKFNWTPSAGQATSRAVRNKIAAEIRRRYSWVTTTASKKALAEIIGRVLNDLARIGPPAPGRGGGSGGGGGSSDADPFWGVDTGS